MDSEYSYLEVRKQGFKEYTLLLEDVIKQKNDSRVKIGRAEGNDIVLPDPRKQVSRYHCVLGRTAGYWSIVDEGSSNGTFVQINGSGTEIDVRKSGWLRLTSGNVILILSQWIEPDVPVFWELTFRDPNETEKKSEFQPPAQFEYSLSQEKLFHITDWGREEMHLRPQERALIHYMAQQNQASNQQPVLCSFQELIEAIWGDPFGHNNNEVTRLVWGIRNKVEPDSGEPKIIQTVKGRGYLLDIKLLQ